MVKSSKIIELEKEVEEATADLAKIYYALRDGAYDSEKAFEEDVREQVDIISGLTKTLVREKMAFNKRMQKL